VCQAPKSPDEGKEDEEVVEEEEQVGETEEEDEEEDEEEEAKKWGAKWKEEGLSWRDLKDYGWTAKCASRKFVGDTWNYFRPGVSKVRGT